jgi:hypothetical protein
MQTMWLLGGLGLGAGLMYLLDPEKGAARRDVVREYVGEYGRQTGGFVDDTGRRLRRQAQTALASTRMPFRRQPGLGERLRTQAEALRLPLGLSLLGGIGLGAGLVALLEPYGGPRRRAWLREHARVYWRKAEPFLSSAVSNSTHPADDRRREAVHAAPQA